MKRFVTYVYIYDKGEKLRNTGFIRVDMAEEMAKLDIRIQNVGRLTSRAPVYVLVKKEKLIAIKIGELDIRNGSGNGQYILEKNNIKRSGHIFDDIAGVRIDLFEDKMLASCWKDEMSESILLEYELWEEANQETKACDSKQVQEDNDNVAYERKPDRFEYYKSNGESECNNQECDNQENDGQECDNKECDDQQPYSSDTLKKIKIADIKSLPKRNWYLCNNSFLLHGFFNYNYLVIKETYEDGKQKFYLGVPGIYERPEKSMALLFGFPEFEAENSNQPEPIGEFGYWYCLLDM